MPDDNNIKNFTAVDIEKYHKGMLSSKERHDMEKAALDDPFLADALEGYNTPGVNTAIDIIELKKRLQKRTSSGKVIPMNTGRRRASGWWKVAAMIILISGAGLLVYRLTIVNNSNGIARLEKDNKSQSPSSPIINDTLKNSQAVTTTENGFSTTNKEKKANDKGYENKKTSNYSVSTNNDIASSQTGASGQAMTVHMDSISISALKKENTFPPANISSSPANEKLEKLDIASSAMKDFKDANKPDAKKAGGVDDAEKEKAEPLFQNKALLNTRNKNELIRNNYFNGRVMDPENNPLPFANITNTADKVGTYSDAKGYFTLISSDSVLNVQVKSIGFENNNFELNSKFKNNQVVLREDRNSVAEVVMSHKKPNSTRLEEMRKANIEIEEPEPEDGWDNYDTYLVNNLNQPVDKKLKQIEGQVEISFDINKNGKPVNFKVEKSLCKPCDDEAIRLVKEGPKWNKKGKKSRARLSVPFNN